MPPQTTKKPQRRAHIFTRDGHSLAVSEHAHRRYVHAGSPVAAFLAAHGKRQYEVTMDNGVWCSRGLLGTYLSCVPRSFGISSFFNPDTTIVAMYIWTSCRLDCLS